MIGIAISYAILKTCDGKKFIRIPSKKLVADNSSAVLSVSALSVRHCSYLCHSNPNCFSASYTPSGAAAGVGAAAGTGTGTGTGECQLVQGKSYTTIADSKSTSLLPIGK